MSQVILWDHALLRKINVDWAHPWADQFFSFMADFGLLFWPLVLVIAAMAIFGRFRERLFIGLLALVLMIGDAGLNSSIKKAVNRPRPYQAMEDIRHVKRDGWWKVRVDMSQPGPVEKGRSMTSGHVCNNVAVGILITLIYAPWGWIIWPWVIAMSYSRVYTADHFPTDVIASWALAFAYTLLICCALQWVWRKYGNSVMPKTFAQHPDLFPAFPVFSKIG
jgi:undecaprenyl-diphosphatase